MTDPKDRRKGGLKKARPQQSTGGPKAEIQKNFAQQIADAKMGGTFKEWLYEYYSLFKWGDGMWPDGKLIEKLRADGVLSEGQAYKDNMSGVKSWLQKKHSELGRAKVQKPLHEKPKVKPLRRI